MEKNNNKEQTQEKIWKVISMFSISVAIFQILLILIWFFEITLFPKLEGMTLLLTPFISPVGMILVIISFIIYRNRLAKLGIISNSILFFLPCIYFYLGTLIFGT